MPVTDGGAFCMQGRGASTGLLGQAELDGGLNWAEDGLEAQASEARESDVLMG